jgi:DNA polymerase-3 subunit delta'
MKVLLHPVTQRLVQAAQDNLGGGYLFFGNSGRGKADAALELARVVNCLKEVSEPCAHCTLIAADAFPDLIRIVPPEGKSIGIDQVRDLQQTLGLSPYSAKAARIVIIASADALTHEAQNALLKLLEEPPPATSFILTAERSESLLPTVRSRLQPVYFAPIDNSVISEWLQEQTDITAAVAKRAAELSAGASELAWRLTQDTALWEAYEELDQAAQALLDASLFDRLVTAKLLADGSHNLAQLVERLYLRTKESLLVTYDSTLAQRLGTIERFYRHTANGVTPRAAFEVLMVGI